MSRTFAAQPVKEFRLGSTVEAMKKLQRKVDRLRHLDGELLLRAGAEVLTAVLQGADTRQFLTARPGAPGGQRAK